MGHRQRRWGLHSRVHVHPWATQTAAPVNHQIPECMCPCTPGPVQTQMRTLSGPSTSSRSCTYENVVTRGFVHASLGVRARECKQGYVHTSEAVHTQKGACLRVLHTQGRAHPRGQPADPSGGGRGAQFPHTWPPPQALGAIFAPRAAEGPADSEVPALGHLLCRLPGVHHAEAPRAKLKRRGGARNGGRGAERRRSDREPRPLSTPGRAHRLPPCAGAQHGARSRVPSDAR